MPQFQKGLFSEAKGSGYVPTFANDLVSTATATPFGNATGDVVVDAGARIATHAPPERDRGRRLCAAGSAARLHNGAPSSSPNGQTTLAAGDSFVISPGHGHRREQDLHHARQ